MKISKMIQQTIIGVLCITLAIPVLPAKAVENNSGIAIDETNFPDDIFREYVLTKFDKNGDGYLSYVSTEDEGYYEHKAVESIDVGYKGIADLTGIEYFENLHSLDCSDNQLTGVLDLSGFKELHRLDCSNNQLSDVKLYNLSEMYYFDVRFNQINEERIYELSDDNVNHYFYPQGENSIIVEITEETFPDDNFREYVLTECDDNSDGYLNVLESYESSEIIISGMRIKNLAGIEHFQYLQSLNCSKNELSGILDLSSNMNLRKVLCQENELTGLLVNHESIRCLDGKCSIKKCL